MNTSENPVHTRNREIPKRAADGWLSLLITIVLYLAAIGGFIAGLMAVRLPFAPTVYCDTVLLELFVT